MQSAYSVDDLILNYDPEQPAERFLAAGLPAALKSATGRLPGPVPWPQGHAPTAAPLPEPPAESDDLGRFRGYDAVVVTWTAAEAAALAALFTPDFLPSRWYEYRHDVATYVPLVTGPRAPFRNRAADMARYFHSLGLKKAGHKAGQIYAEGGAFTTAASAIASWAIIDARFNHR